MSDEDTLRRQAREAMEAQRLPSRRPQGTWGGKGSGSDCDVCGRPINPDEIAFEIEFSPDQETALPRDYHLHSKCFAAWEFERDAFESGAHKKHPSGPAPSTTSAQGIDP